MEEPTVSTCIGINSRHHLAALGVLAALVILTNPSAAFGQEGRAGVGGCAPDCTPLKQNIECLNPSPQYDNRTFVGQILLNGSGWCTAWIVASNGVDSIVMTNEHCTVGQTVTNMDVKFNFQCNACVGGAPEATVTFPVTALITQNAALDYALLRVSGDPAATFGIATIDSSTLAVGQAIYEIHHAGTLVKGYDEGTVLNLSTNQCVNNEIAVSNLVASGGASGSPIFRFDNHCVAAICNCGPNCQDGFGVPMSNIIPNAQPILQAAGFDFTGCFGPNNDLCANRRPIFNGKTPFSNVGASFDGPVDPVSGDHCVGTMTSDVWWNYTAEFTGTVDIDTCQSTGIPTDDTTLVVYDGCDCAIIHCGIDGLPGGVLAQADDSCAPPGGGNAFLSSVKIPVIAGNCYKIQVGGWDGNGVDPGSQGTGIVTITKQPPNNDLCANRRPIFNGKTPFDNFGASFDGPVDPVSGAHCQGIMTSDVWWNYTADFTGTVDIDTCQSIGIPTDDTTLVVYDGCDCATLHCGIDGLPGGVLAQGDDDCAAPGGGNAFLSSVKIPVVAGNCYKIQVGGWNAGGMDPGTQGSGIVTITKQTPNNDLCANRRPIFNGKTPFDNLGASFDGPVDPISGAPCVGTMTGDVWWNYTAEFTGTVEIDTCQSTGIPTDDTTLVVYDGCDCAIIHCGIDGLPGGVLAQADDSCAAPPGGGNPFLSSVKIPVIAGNCYKIQVGGFNGTQGSGIVTITKQPPNNDLCANRRPIFNGKTPFDNIGTSFDGPTDPVSGAPCQSTMTGDVWWNYTAEFTGTVNIDTCQSTGIPTDDTTLVVYDGCDCAALHCGIDGLPGGVLAQGDDDCAAPPGGGNPFLSSVKIPIVQGNCYKIQVGGFFGTEGSGIVTITKQPGACCIWDGTCVDVVGAAECAALFGTYQGDGTVCLGDNDGDGVDDACPPLPQGANLFTDPAAFQAALPQDKRAKAKWDFKPNDLPPASAVGLDDPLNIDTHGLNPDDPWTDAAGTDLWPPSVDNVMFQSNLGPNPQAPQPNPRGVDGLLFATPGIADNDNNILLADFPSDSFDILSGPPAGDNHTAMALEIFSVFGTGPGPVFVTVFDKNEVPVGKIKLDLFQNQPPECGDATAGDCCVANGTPGCDRKECCVAICAADPFCCDNQWDSICADAAALDPVNCPQCAPPPPGECDGQICGTYTFDCDPLDPTCICITRTDGSGTCVADIGCAAAVPCPGGDGDCPPGFVCAIDTCCGTPICMLACGAVPLAPPPPGALMASGIAGSREVAKGRALTDRAARGGKGGVAGGPIKKAFLGIVMKGNLTIGRVNLYDLGGGSEGISSFTVYADFPGISQTDIAGPLGPGVPDGCVDAFDLALLLNEWCSSFGDPDPAGDVDPPCEGCASPFFTLADINGPNDAPDGCVDAFDLAKLLNTWCSVFGGNPCGTCGPPPPFCGNGVIDPGEDCDPPGVPCGTGLFCQPDCTCPPLP